MFPPFVTHGRRAGELVVAVYGGGCTKEGDGNVLG